MLKYQHGTENECFVEENLAEEIRKYRCLYDKSCEDFKDKFKNKNAWKEVEEALGIEEGKQYFI